MKQIADLPLSDKKVLLRADLDVPLTGVAFEEASTRLTNLKPSVDQLFNENAKIIIIGHIDRPQKPDPALSTRQLIDPLQKIFKRTIVFKKDFPPSPEASHFAEASSDKSEGQAVNPDTGSGVLESQVTLFENLRFWPGEVNNDQEFARKLANLADFYVNDAFGNCHRSHASMVGVPQLLPSAVGSHLKTEIDELSKLIKNPQHPLIAIVGGAKIETKLPVIENLAKIADFVLVGGELPIEIKKFDQRTADNVIVAALADENKDLSQESIEKFIKVIKSAKTVVWNGPQGMFEEGFSHGSLSVAKAIIESGAHCVVGGGETTQFLEQNNLLSKFSFVSAGGGAMLDFLAGKKLPALELLE